MMASIPNMRSTPLPLPGGKAPPTETAAGDFAAQLPRAQGKNLCAVAPPLTEAEGVALAIPDVADMIGTSDGEAPAAQAEAAETSDTATPPQPDAVTIPFLQTAPAPRVMATPVGDGTPPAPAQPPVVQAPTGKAAGRTGSVTTPSLQPPAGTSAPQAPSDTSKPETAQPEEPQADSRQIEAAVKELLQRKQATAKPAIAAPVTERDGGSKPETAPAEAKAQVQPQVQATATPAASHTPAPAAPSAIVTLAEQPQPALAPTGPQPSVARAEGAGTLEPARATDLVVERQLDLARDAEWLDRLARDIARAGASDTPLRFRLHPQTLGHLQVEMQQGERGTAVRLTVETEAARQLLADAQPRLAAEARAQGVRIAETHVDLSGSGREAPGDRRRQDETQQAPFVRTARGAGEEAVTAARTSRRARLDRYA